jgi:hypothetical protein
MSKNAMSSEQASAVKRQGHKREEKFNKRFGNENDKINYSGSSPDCLIREGHDILNTLKKSIGTDSRYVSIKGGNTIQIHLGNLPELTDKSAYTTRRNWKGQTCVEHGIPFQQQERQLRQKSFWDTYLKKGDVLAYSYDNGKYIWFNMEDVINFVIKECKWRFLETGRLKGDIQGKQYLTYEYRAKKDSFVLGAHGGKKGKEFIELLQSNIRHCII